MDKAGRESLVEDLIVAVFEETGVEMVREFKFHPRRRWRFDLATLVGGGLRVALEIEGGVWVAGRHVRGAGFLGDIEKYNEASLAGWTVLRCTWSQVKNGEALALLLRALGGQDVEDCG